MALYEKGGGLKRLLLRSLMIGRGNQERISKVEAVHSVQEAFQMTISLLEDGELFIPFGDGWAPLQHHISETGFRNENLTHISAVGLLKRILYPSNRAYTALEILQKAQERRYPMTRLSPLNPPSMETLSHTQTMEVLRVALLMSLEKGKKGVEGMGKKNKYAPLEVG